MTIKTLFNQNGFTKIQLVIIVIYRVFCFKYVKYLMGKTLSDFDYEILSDLSQEKFRLCKISLAIMFDMETL